MIRYRVHCSTPTFPILIHINLIHALQYYLLMIRFNIMLSSQFLFAYGLFLSGFPTKTCMYVYSPP